MDKNMKLDTSKPYYKELIRIYGLWYSPEMLAKILKEANSYRWFNRKGPFLFWKDIAKEIGVSASTLSKTVSGRQFPSDKTMKKLIRYFDLREEVITVNNYEILKKYDNAKLDHNWVYVRDRDTDQEGVAVLSKDDKVRLFIGSNTGEDDKTISIEDFNINYIIYRITDHFGHVIEGWDT